MHEPVIADATNKWAAWAPFAGPWGTITLTQDGSNIDVDVSLDPNVYFADTGAGGSFLWSLSGAPTLTSSDVVFTGASIGNFTFVSTLPTLIHEDGTGYWDYGIGCSGCGNGGSPPRIGGNDALTFTIDGYSFGDFVKDVDKQGNPLNDFAADLCMFSSGQCSTGDVVATTDTPSTSVPEPMTFTMFGAGLLGVAGLRRRRKAKRI